MYQCNERATEAGLRTKRVKVFGILARGKLLRARENIATVWEYAAYLRWKQDSHSVHGRAPSGHFQQRMSRIDKLALTCRKEMCLSVCVTVDRISMTRKTVAAQSELLPRDHGFIRRQAPRKDKRCAEDDASNACDEREKLTRRYGALIRGFRL